MGKRLISQRRGKGSSTYRCPEKSFSPKIEYSNQVGIVRDIVNDTRRDAPLAKIEYSDHHFGYIIAPEGLRTGQTTDTFVRQLKDIPEGTRIFSIETAPNTGPRLCRTPGTAATLVSKGKECIIQLPSKTKKTLHPNCVASIGIPSGEGQNDKPLLKAGKKWIIAHKRGKLYPRTSGKAMNAVDHPYGGSGHGKRRSPVSRDAPHGRKVGPISPRRTGIRKRK
ncbi:MAG: 50S ribosomal protein L2 [Candidatus Aenigmatarchaeota archaeon]